MPRVSIIIPTYNRPHYLKLTLKNVFEQTFTDFEVIVVDDGTPGNENCLICEAFDHVIYKKIENTGSPIVPRNEGLKIAQSEYIAFIDDDDLWRPDKLQMQVDILDNNLDFGLVHSCCKVIDADGHETGEITGRLREPMRKHGNVFDDMIGNFTVMMVTPLIRRDTLNHSGGFNTRMAAAGEDTEFFVRLSFITKFYYIDEPLAYYRVHGKNISTANFGYVHLPFQLFKVLKHFRSSGLINSKRYKPLRKRLLLRQIEQITDRQSAKVAKENLKKMYPLYFIIPKVIFSLIKRMKNIKQKQ